MSKLILALLLAAFAVANLPRIGRATNYREYKKFDLTVPAERAPSKRHINLNERSYHHRCAAWREFLHRNW
jgi:hypothetical protein